MDGLSRPYPGTVRPHRPYQAEVEPKKTIFLLCRVVIPAWNWLIHRTFTRVFGFKSPGFAGSKPAARARPLFHSPIRLQPDGKFFTQSELPILFLPQRALYFCTPRLF